MVDLNKCKCGDKLLTRNGTILIYVAKLPQECYYDHLVTYPNGSGGTRMSDGYVFKNASQRYDTDEDVILISGVDDIFDESEWI